MKLFAFPALALCVLALVSNAYALPQNKNIARSNPGSLLGKRYVARLERDVPKQAKTSNSDVPVFQQGSSNAAAVLDNGGTGKFVKASKKNVGRPVRKNRKTRFNRSLKRRKGKTDKQPKVAREGPEGEQNLVSKQGASPTLDTASSSPPDASATSAVAQASSAQSPDVTAPTTSTPPPVSTANQKAMKKAKANKPTTPNPTKAAGVRARRRM